MDRDTIQPTEENSRILGEIIAIKVKEGLKQRYPTAEDVLEDLR